MNWFGGLRIKGCYVDDGTEGANSGGGTDHSSETEQVISSILDDDALPGLEAEGDEGEGEGKPKDESPKPDPKLEEVSRRLEALEEKNVELIAENTILRTRERAPAPAQPVREETEPEFTNDQFREIAKTDPIKAISTVVERAIKRSSREITTHVDRQTTYQRQLDKYRTDVMSDFGELLNSNKEFAAAAEEEYAALADENGNHRPADLYAAVSTAHSKWTRQGKLEVKPNGNGNGPASSLRERLRQPQNGPGPSNSSPADRQGATPFDRDFRTQRDLAAVTKQCRKFGITLEAFKKNYNDEKKRNSRYGEGA